jgi:hypothetical protein
MRANVCRGESNARELHVARRDFLKSGEEVKRTCYQDITDISTESSHPPSGVHQRFRETVLRSSQESIYSEALYDLPTVKHRHSVADRFQYPEIMRDDQNGGPETLITSPQQVQDLLLCNCVQRAGRFVRNDEGGAMQERHCN